MAAITNSSAIEMFRSRSFGSPSWSSTHAAKSVKTEKLTTSPATIAYGLRRPPRRAAREHDRQHGEDARRDGRDQPGDEADAQNS